RRESAARFFNTSVLSVLQTFDFFARREEFSPQRARRSRRRYGEFLTADGRRRYRECHNPLSKSAFICTRLWFPVRFFFFVLSVSSVVNPVFGCGSAALGSLWLKI